jgi:HAD superfamily hydrolase (TIGR01509 family)
VTRCTVNYPVPSVVIQAALFDLFETLVTESAASVRRASSLASQLGVNEEVYRRQWRSRRHDVVLGRRSFRQTLADIVRSAGGTPDENLLERLRLERVNQKTVVLCSVEPEVLAAVGTLRARGIKLAVVTNSFPEDVAGWDRSPLGQLFDLAIVSSAVGLAKPDPRIFLLACDLLRVSPAGTLFIGDGEGDELAGARAAGLSASRALWFVSRWPNTGVTRADSGLWRPADVVGATMIT